MAKLSRISGICVCAAFLLAASASLTAQQPGFEIPHGPSVRVAALADDDAMPSAPLPIVEQAPAADLKPLPGEFATHRFWDRQNTLLFAAVGGLAAADFCVTHANLASGGQELNPVAGFFSRSTPMLAANFALETGGVIGVSYLFHKTGHHRLERIVSLVNIGGSAAAVAFDYTHR